MPEQEPGSGLRGSLAGAREPAAERHSALPDSPEGGEELLGNDLHDISKILLGAQAISGKALSSSKRMSVNEDARQHTVREQQRLKDEREARELANLARWNAQMTTVGGVQMTNEQAQKARQNVIDNDDAYVDWAVRKGLIRADQKDEFKEGVRLKKELEEKRGRGTLTAEDAEREAKLDRSDAGKAIDAATAYSHQHNGVTPAPEVKSSDADRTLRGTADVVNRPGLFQSAPDASVAFQTASSTEAEKKPTPAPSSSPSVRASGLDL